MRLTALLFCLLSVPAFGGWDQKGVNRVLEVGPMISNSVYDGLVVVTAANGGTLYVGAGVTGWRLQVSIDNSGTVVVHSSMFSMASASSDQGMCLGVEVFGRAAAVYPLTIPEYNVDGMFLDFPLTLYFQVPAGTANAEVHYLIKKRIGLAPAVVTP